MTVRKSFSRREKLIAFLAVLLIGLILGNLAVYLPRIHTDSADRILADELVTEMDRAIREATHVAIVSAEDERPYESNIYISNGNLYLDGVALYRKTEHENRKIRMLMTGEGHTFTVNIQFLDNNSDVSYAQDASFHANELKLLRRQIEGRAGEELLRPVISFTGSLG